MNIEHVAAFSFNGAGGNPAGVVLSETLPDADAMQGVARDLGYSETVFASPEPGGWTTRYFAPAGEVDFCGHATIALGAILGEKFGAGSYELSLSRAKISVEAIRTEAGWVARLQSPSTWSEPMSETLLGRLLDLFGLEQDDLDPQLPPTLAFAGVRHAILTLRSRERLARMDYPFEPMRRLMGLEGLTTVSLLHVDGPLEFSSRNAFAIGGVMEDPATGAAAAALGGALVDLGWPELRGGGAFTIRQGADMGRLSVLKVEVTGRKGESVAVSGAVSPIKELAAARV
jgi:PhzF family phenazine biosynthesis protein